MGGGGAEVDDLGRAEAVDEARRPRALPAGVSAWARALAAVKAATAPASARAAHGGLAAAIAGAGRSAAAGRLHVVAHGIAIPEPAALESRRGITGRCRETLIELLDIG